MLQIGLIAEFACGHDPDVPLKVAYVDAAAVNSYTDEKTGETVHHGKTIGFFKYLNKAYGWTTEHVVAPDRRWGSPWPNGSFYGMIGMVERREVDMAACLITINSIRATVVDFTFPYYFDTVRLLSNRPGYAPKLEVLAWPFQLSTWLAIFISFLPFSMMFYGVIRLAGDKSYTFSICLMECYKQYFGASTHEWPSKPATKMIFVVWCFMAMILSKAYSSNLLAGLTKQITLPKIDTLEDLSNSKYHELLFMGQTNKRIFHASTEPHIKRAYKKHKGKMVGWLVGQVRKVYLDMPGAVVPVDKEGVNLLIEQSWGLPAGQAFTRWSSDYVTAIFHGIALQTGSKLKEGQWPLISHKHSISLSTFCIVHTSHYSEIS